MERKYTNLKQNYVLEYLLKFRVFWDTLKYSKIDLTTRQYIPEDSELHTRRRENLKSYMNIYCFLFIPFYSLVNYASWNLEEKNISVKEEIFTRKNCVQGT
jgi:hypothetical protein